MDLRQFLETVVTGEKGYFCLALGGETQWYEEWYHWPAEIDKIVERAHSAAPDNNVYFSSYLFKAASSSKEHVLPTRTIQADLDEADIFSLPAQLQPTVLVQTSPGRHQGYWILNKALEKDTHELLSMKLTYAIEKCDHSGWPLGRKVRVPETLNHKYLDGPKNVLVASVSHKTYDPTDIELLPDVPKTIVDKYDESFIETPPELDIGPQELFQKYKKAIPPKIAIQYNSRQDDRSTALWALMLALFRAGATKEEVFCIAKGSANNKFDRLRFNADKELAKDVLRAEAVVHINIPDERTIIGEAKKLSGLASERRAYMQKLVIDFMQRKGEFFHTVDDAMWYVRNDVGRPISLTVRSQYLITLLDMQFGLNATEADQSYIINGLCAYAQSLPLSGITSSLSLYDQRQKFVLLHTGKKEVVVITKDSIEKAVDGAHNVVFPWSPTNEPFSFDLDSEEVDWGDIIFGDTVKNAIGLNSERALVLLQVWFMFLIFRNAAVSRPILALFGQPGSGKSTLFRRLYALLYGRQRAVGGVTSADDYDYAVAADPLVVLDNVDTWERWLPDRLALSSSTSDRVKRTLWTDKDVTILKRQALVGITAHNPKFGREDVADRLILITLKRLEHFDSEGTMIDEIIDRRNALWGSIVKDIQRVLATPMPPIDETPQFRIEDFAKIGYWIASAIGKGNEFAQGLQEVRSEQRSFSLEEEQILVNAILKYVEKVDQLEVYRSVGMIWTKLEALSGDTDSFKRKYKNAVNLGKKLLAMQEPLSQVVSVGWKFDSVRGAKIWRFMPKGNLQHSDNGVVK